MRVVAAPASLKGVLSAEEAAAALGEGLRRAGVDADEAPVADGGEGTAAVLARAFGGEWRSARVSDPLGRQIDARWLLLPDGVAVVEAAEAAGLGLVPPAERDPLRATTHGVGELLLAAIEGGAEALVVCLGGTGTVDGGAGLLERVPSLSLPVTVACDVSSPLLGPRGAARAFGPQKGADAAAVEELERRLTARDDLAPYAHLPGAGAAGGLGAALAALGGELVSGAELVLRRIGLPERIVGADLVVTGEGRVDATTFEGKAPAAVLAACTAAGVRGALFGGVVLYAPEGFEVHALSGDSRHAREDLVALAERLVSDD